MKEIKILAAHDHGKTTVTNGFLGGVNDWCYCEIESSQAQETCKKQCKHCKTICI